jgi:two-component system, LytTR family, response regulator LytT
MKVLIIEDEAYNAEHIAAHLEQYGGMELLTTVPSNSDLEKWLQHNPAPELIFADIQLLDGPVFNSLEKGLVSCPIIFTTAYDTFYQEAFDTNGIAYLLKPISYERLKKAIDKFYQLQTPKTAFDWAGISQLLSTTAPKTKERILVKHGENMQVLSLKNVCCITTHEGICTATDNKGLKYEFRYKLSDLAAELDANLFFQINRSEIVNVEFIESISPYFNDRLSIKVKAVKQQFISSAATTAAFKKWIEK